MGLGPEGGGACGPVGKEGTFGRQIVGKSRGEGSEKNLLNAVSPPSLKMAVCPVMKQAPKAFPQLWSGVHMSQFLS